MSTTTSPEHIPLTDADFARWCAAIANRRPAVGLAVGVIGPDGLERFHGHGFADIRSGTPVTEDTVFRIGSITKTFTAVAVMLLSERGLIDLDAPAGTYLRGFALVPAKTTHRPPTVRNLLTHTAGLPELVHPSRVAGPVLGETVPFGRRVPTLGEFYRGRLHLVAEPGTRHTYSNHGFATLGQIVEDVSGQPLASHLREHIFEPLGMRHTDLNRSDRVRAGLATGYALRSAGPRPVRDFDLVTIGGGSVYSTTADLARYGAALLNARTATVEGGTGPAGSILGAATLHRMFAPQYQADPRVPGIGLAFFRKDAGGHPVVEHDGLLPGFTSQLSLAPDDGLGIVAFTNGARGARAWLSVEVSALLRHLLGVPEPLVRNDVPQHPEIWTELCGRYSFRGSGRDVQKWFVAGAAVVVRRGLLTLRTLSPVPALVRGLTLHPDDDRDPYAFRVDLACLGLGTSRVVFSHTPRSGVTAFHLEFAPLSFDKRRRGGQHRGGWT